jgi:hypothetical protein
LLPPRSSRSIVAATRIAGVSILGSIVSIGSPRAEPASSLINEGDLLTDVGGGQRVTELHNTAANHVGGYAISLTSSNGALTLSHIWGKASPGPGVTLRTEASYGTYVQTSFEDFYGIADDGALAYSASGIGGPVGGFDSVWKDDVVVMMEGDPFPHAPDRWWRFGLRPGITRDGRPYWIGGIADVQGGSTTNRGLFFDFGGTPLLLGGDSLPHLPDPLSTDNTVSPDYRFSAQASHWIVEVEMEGMAASNNAIVVDGEGLLLAGSLVCEGSTIPESIGGGGGEAWDNFDFVGITESGEHFLTGDSDGPSASDELVVKNGVIVTREGDELGGATLAGAIEGAYMNEDGDLALVWDIEDPQDPALTLEALYLNDTLVLRVGDEVDLDGDGEIDRGAVLTDFTGTSSLTVSDRDHIGQVTVLFTADVDTAGTASSTDDIQGFYAVPVNPPPIPVRLSGLAAQADARMPLVRVEWQTSLEIDHAGFHVYRSRAHYGRYERMTDRMITGSRAYSWVDRHVRPSTTYFYKVGAVDLNGREVLYGPASAATPAWGIRTVLAPSRPNPFVRRTLIGFTLANESVATLTIHDVMGRRIATLVEGKLPAGDHEITWDGIASSGRPNASGVYFYRLEADGVRQTRKLVRLSGD